VSSGGTGITINAPSTATVHLNGLLIEGGHVGAQGIMFNSGASLTVENCIVRNLTSDGLDYFSSATTLQTLAISNSYFNDNTFNGIVIALQGSGVLNASVDRTGFYNNGDVALDVDGAAGTGSLSVAVTDSVATNNGSGFFVGSTTGHSTSNLSLTHSVSEGNGSGVEAQGANATLWLAQSTVTGNSIGFDATSGGVIKTYGDNYLLAGNGSNTGSLTNVSRQ
jgi:hypothetical protein